MISGAKLVLELKKFVVGILSTNCYLLWDALSRKGVLIDPGANYSGISRYIKENSINVVCIVNTHGHPDHVAANGAFGYPVLIHESDVSWLDKRPDRFLKDGDTIDAGAFSLKVLHTPGHTPGCISLECRDMLFSGDTLFLEGIGRTDLPGGSYEKIVESIKGKLFTLADSVRVFPGHGPETTIGHEKQCNPFL